MEEVAEAPFYGSCPGLPLLGELLDRDTLSFEQSDGDDGGPISNRRESTERGPDFPPVPVPPRLDPKTVWHGDGYNGYSEGLETRPGFYPRHLLMQEEEILQGPLYDARWGDPRESYLIVRSLVAGCGR